MNAAEALALSRRAIGRAWAALPSADRRLLEAIRAEQWDVTDRPLGVYTDDLRRSAGYASFPALELQRQDAAAGIWIRLEYAVARVAWHEWGHALAFHQATDQEIAAGHELLELVPESLAGNIRSADYRQREYTHEIVAEVYALLMIRCRQGAISRPPWLSEKVYELVRRVVGWSQ
jgi:hypothetical protein